MRIKKAKEAARTREKEKNAAAQAEVDATDPEYAPPSDEEDIVASPVASTSKPGAKKPEEARIQIIK
jgi:hypothetical protein